MSKHSRSGSPSSSSSPRRWSVVAVIGGDGRRFRPLLADGVDVRVCASSKHGGNGRLHSVLFAIRAGSIDLVILLTRWLGHSESRAVVDACRAGGVPVRIIAGGMTSAARALSTYVDREVHRGG
jgi:hypothetical protein